MVLCFSRQRDSDAQLDREDEQIVDELTQTLKEWSRAMRKNFINLSASTVSYYNRCTSFALSFFPSPFEKHNL